MTYIIAEAGSVKWCSRCAQHKPTDAFNRKQNWCKPCRLAYKRERYKPTPRQWPALEVRFWSKVDRRGADECWPWMAAIRTKREDRGAFWFKGRQVQAPRIAWELTNGAIPDGLWALHRCDNPRCCNPAHLFLGTPLDNATDRETKGRGNRGKALLSRRRTHCPKGHAYVAGNIYVNKSGASAGERTCLTCKRENMRRWRAKQRAA